MPTQDYIVASGASCNGRAREIRGLQNIQTAYWNRGVAHPVEHARRRGKGELAGKGAMVGRTGQLTGRSANHKYIVRNPLTGPCVQGSSVNQAKSEPQFNGLFQRMQPFWCGREVCVQDRFVGADAEFGLLIRAIGESASTVGLAIAAGRAVQVIFYALCA